MTDFTAVFDQRFGALTSRSWNTKVDLRFNITSLQYINTVCISGFSFIIMFPLFLVLQATSAEAALNQRRWI